MTALDSELSTIDLSKVSASTSNHAAKNLLKLSDREVDPLTLLAEAQGIFHHAMALSCSFSIEDVSLVHMLAQVCEHPRVFAIDTGRLPEETLECAEAIRRRYGIQIEWHYPDQNDVLDLVKSKGLFSFKGSVDERRECCFIRKVAPLKAALAGLKCWITGQRREQSETRGNLSQIEVDHFHNSIIKLNPLAHWKITDVKRYVSEHAIPYNRLYNQGFTSIGCAPCTRAVKEGEHERAGRWWWEDPEHKECGLHQNHILDEITDAKNYSESD